jgi:uncharacterized membrane protein YkoI
MKNRNRTQMVKALATAILLGGLVANISARADDADDRDAVLQSVEKGEIRSLAEIRKTIIDQFQGDIVHIGIKQRHGRRFYEFKVLRPDGRLIEIKVDPATKDILEIENE